MHLAPSLLALTAAALTATLASASQQVPLLGFSSPKVFLGLDDGFSKEIGTIMFIPGFHSCGTLLVLSVPGLTYDDFDHLPTLNASTNPPTGSGFLEAYEDAASQVKEDDSYEMTIEAWTRGWARSCGKGAKMKEVRVAKLDVGLDGASVSERPEKMVALDAAIAPHLSSLPSPPHPHTVLLTSLTPSTLTKLLSIASSSTSPSTPSHPQAPISTLPDKMKSRRRRHSPFVSLLISTFWSLAMGGLAFGAWKLWKRVQERRKGGDIRLLETDELDMDAEPL